MKQKKEGEGTSRDWTSISLHYSPGISFSPSLFARERRPDKLWLCAFLEPTEE